MRRFHSFTGPRDDVHLSITISVGEDFKAIVWKAQYDMDFSTECLFCSSDRITGYRVEDESGRSGKVAVCPKCEKVNAIYTS